MSKPSSSQRVYYLIHFPLICLPGVFFTTINHTTWINSKLGVLHREALNCRVIAPIIASLPWPDPTIHSYWCLIIHVQKPPTWSLIIINPPLSLYLEWKAWIPPFASASFLQTYHLSPLISYSGPTWQPCQKEVPTDLLSTCLICSIQTILHPTCSPTLVIAENPETRIRFFKTCSGGRSEIEHQWHSIVRLIHPVNRRLRLLHPLLDGRSSPLPETNNCESISHLTCWPDG